MKTLPLTTTLTALVVSLALVGCSSTDESQPAQSSASASSTATATSSESSASATPSAASTPTIRSTTPADTGGDGAQADQEEAAASSAPEAVQTPEPGQGGAGYQKPQPDANGYVGPSEEYYSYRGYVAPGFEYQVGSECFDPSLGRCKTSGEIQKEYMDAHPPAATPDVAGPGNTGGFPIDQIPDQIEGAVNDGNGCYYYPDTGELHGCI